MTTITIIGFGIACALAIIIASYLYDNKKHGSEPYMFGAGTLLLLLIGLLLVITPLQTTTGYVTNTTEPSLEVVTYTHTADTTLVSYAVGMVFVLTGWFGTVNAVRRIRFGDEPEEDSLDF
jgi:hypothetical protein